MVRAGMIAVFTAIFSIAFSKTALATQTLRIEAADSAIPELSEVCEGKNGDTNSSRYFFDDNHRAAVAVLEIGDQNSRKTAAAGAFQRLAKIRKAALASFAQNDTRRAIIDADYGLLGYAAGKIEHADAEAKLKAAFAYLYENGKTEQDGNYLIYIAKGPPGFSRIGWQAKERDSAVSLASRLAEMMGANREIYFPIKEYLASDLNNHPDYREKATDKVSAALTLRQMSLAANDLYSLYIANSHLIRDFPGAGEDAAAAILGKAMYPAAVVRLNHMRDEALRTGQNHRDGCWAEDAVIANINKILKTTYTNEQAKAAYMNEALESVLFGTLETDVFGASIHLSKLAAVKSADSALYRYLLANLNRLQGRPDDPADSLPQDISMALMAGDIFEDILQPDLARDFYKDAASWLSESDSVRGAARLKALNEIMGFEWRSGNLSRLDALYAQTLTLLAENPDVSAEADYYETVASYKESQLIDDEVAGLVVKAFEAGGGQDLLKEHLLGRFCSSCGSEITPFIGAILDEMRQSMSGLTSGFPMDAELALLILTSKSAAVDDVTRKTVTDAVANAQGYARWKSELKSNKVPHKKLSEAELMKLWLAAQALGYADDFAREYIPHSFQGTESSEIAVAAFLLEPKLGSKRSNAAPMLDIMASHASEFGDDNSLIGRLDLYARLLQQTGYSASARVITENTARLSASVPDFPEWSSWSPLTDEARLQLAPVLGAVHARMGRYAFEDRRWQDADASLAQAMSLMKMRLAAEWRFGSERAVLLYRQMQPALRLSAQLRFLMASDRETAEVMPGLRDAALSDLQYAMLGETGFTMQAAARKRIYADAELSKAVTARDDAQDRLAQLEALEKALPSKLPWIIEERRREAKATIAAASETVARRLAMPEELVALRSFNRSAVESVLDADEALLVLHAGSNTLYGFAMRPGRDPVLFTSPVGISALTDSVAKMRLEGSKFGSIDLENARAVYDQLLAPAGDIFDGIGNLIVVGDGPVPAIPFSMLVTGDAASDPEEIAVAKANEPENAVRGAKSLSSLREVDAGDLQNQQWLIRRYPVSIAPSIASVVTQRSEIAPATTRKPFLGIGDPVLQGSQQIASIDMDRIYTRSGEVDAAVLASLVPLPETATELRALAASFGAGESDLLLGANATQTKLMNADLSQFKVLAFATHGILAGEVSGIAEPGLVLSPENAQGQPSSAGYLPLSDIMALKLNADMVILSACNTGGSDGRPRAEAMSGLARGFIAAGARQLMVTLWSIPSDPTTRLTTGTVAALETGRRAAWPRAMRLSILKMLDAPVTSMDAHPVSWGAFTILGAGGNAP